jgi:hypothetical protein
VPNPWFGILPANRALGASPNIARRELLRGIPQFNSVQNFINPWGRVWCHGLQVRFEKRAFLPFGRGRRYLASAGGVSQFLIGGWTANANLIYQSGVPLGAWRDWEFLCGNPAVANRIESQWVFNDRSRFNECWRQLRPFEYRELGNRFHHLRSQTAPQIDLMISKKFNATERIQLEFRGEAFNAFNTPLRGDPPSTNPAGADFGILPVAQLNFPRNVQLGMRVRF